MAKIRGEAEPDMLHRAIIEGQLDVHPTLNAIVVNYQMDAVVVSVYGEPMVADTKECRKLIKLQNLDSSTDIQALAWHIVSKCDLISGSRVPEVEQLLSYLQNRSKGKDSDRDVLESSSRQIQEQIKDLQNPTENASMSDLDSYLEYLYEDMQGKIRGTGLILQLARTPDNLCFLMENESLFLALARVLKEDWKKSIELSTNIVYIFFCFSTFSIFHKMLAQHKIGSTCMVVLEHEMKRHKSLQDDLTVKKKSVKSDDGVASSKGKKEYEVAKKKYQQLLKKQETLLRVTLYLLLNLSEDTRVELKMRNKGLIPHLISLLERSNQELLILVISFLKKLSIYAENKDDMAKAEIVKKISKLISCDNEILVNVTLRLLLNLSFDPKLRQEMVKQGFLPMFTSMLKQESHRVVVLCILYHISMNSKARSMFSCTDCIPELMRLIIECQDELVDPEAIALGINLACSPRNVQIMCNGPGLKLLVRRALNTQDSLLLKMIRNIAKCPGDSKKLFLPFLSELCILLKDCDSKGEDEVCVEVLGILANMLLPDIDFYRVVTELDLLPFITSKLQKKDIQDDLLLEVVILCGTFALDEKCACLLVEAGVPNFLITILKAKQEDDEMVLQIVYLFYHLVLHEPTRDIVAKQSLAPDYLLELMNDKNKEVCKLCSKTLDIILECDPALALKIKNERFRWHNFQWLEIMTGETMRHEAVEPPDEDYLDPHYLHTAAEIYEMPTGQDVEFESGQNFDPFADDANLAAYYALLSQGGGAPDGRYSPVPPYMLFPQGSEGNVVDGDKSSGVLSPRQYSMLMNSMKDPVAMYAAMPEPGKTASLEHFDPLNMYTSQPYNISPTYAEGQDEEVSEEQGHPIFAMMSSGQPTQQRPPAMGIQPRPPAIEFQPRPPAIQPRPPPMEFQPRPPTSVKKPLGRLH